MKNRKNMKIGSTVRKLRKSRGWTQEKLAKKAGITIVYLSEIENNKTPQVSLMVAKELARALRVPVSVIAGDISLEKCRKLGYRSCCLRYK